MKKYHKFQINVENVLLAEGENNSKQQELR